MDTPNKIPLTHNLSNLVSHNGVWKESKIWSHIGKGLCIWLVLKYPEALIAQWEALLVLLLFMIAPELIKKFITMRWGSNSNYSGLPRRQEDGGFLPGQIDVSSRG